MLIWKMVYRNEERFGMFNEGYAKARTKGDGVGLSERRSGSSVGIQASSSRAANCGQ